jgi:PAS domain S-box-containing protein
MKFVFLELMKYNIQNMKGLDLFLANLNGEQYSSLKEDLQQDIFTNIGLLSWGLKDFYEGSDEIKDIYAMNALAESYNWNVNVEKLLQQYNYESLVITDADKKIIWVNEGFSRMTGYSKEFALNKTPRFLQGSDTSERTRGRIRSKILKNEPFKDVVINYRKDQSKYKCELRIFPLQNQDATYYLALEKEVV